MLGIDNQIRSVPTRIEEIWDVKALTDEGYKKGDNKACDILSRMETLRLDRVNAADEKLREELQKISERCAEENKTLAYRLISQLNYVEEKLWKETETEAADGLRDEWNEAVDDWRYYVWQMNGFLSADCTKALAEHRKLLIASKNFTQDRIITIMGNIVLELNQIIINNERIYANTELHLKLLGETIVKEWKYLQEQREIERRNQMLKEEPEEEEDATPPDNYLNDKISLLDGKLSEPASRINTNCYGNELTPLLEHLDTCSRNMSSLERETMGLIKTYIGAHVVDRSTEDRENGNESFVEYQFHKDLSNSFLTRLEDYSAETQRLSREMARLWDEHVNRLLAGGDLIVAAMSSKTKSLTNNIRIMEKDHNKLLDKLRESSTDDQLRETLDSIAHIWEQMKHIYEKRNSEEKTFLKKYEKMCETARNLTLAEIGLLTEGIPKREVPVPPITSEISIPDEGEVESNEVHEINCKFTNIQYWMDGFFEAVGTISQELKKYTKRWYGDWYARGCAEADERLKNELEKLENRKSRVKRDVHDVRSAELVAHSKRLISHESAIKDVFTQMMSLNKQVEDNIKALTEDLNRWIKENLNEAQPIKSLHAITRYKEKIRSKADACNNTKIRITKQAKLIVDRKILWMRRANVGFIKAIRLFSEGGNYSSEEAKSTVEKLKRIDRLIDKTGSKIRMKFAKSLAKSMKSIDLDYLSNAMASWNAIARRLDFEEKQTLLVDKVKKALRREVYNAKCCNRNVDILLINRTGVLEENHWTKISEELCFCLLYFSVPPDSEKLECEGFIERSDQKGKQNDWRGNKFLFLYTKLLSENRIDNFLQNTKTILNTQYNIILALIDDFYKKQNKETNEGKIKKKAGKKSEKKEQSNMSEYRGAIEEMTGKLQNYNYQCEIAWLAMVYDILCTIFKMRTFCNEYVRKQLNEFQNTWSNELKNIGQDVFSKLEQTAINGRKEWRMVQEKLKPWHGYPENRPLLNQLHQEADKHCKKVAADQVYIVLEHRESLKQKVNDLINQFENLFGEMKRIQDIVFNEENIADKLSATLSFVVRFLRTGNKEDFADLSFTSINYPAEPYRLCKVVLALLEKLIPEKSFELMKEEVSALSINPVQDLNSDKFDLQEFAQKYKKKISDEKKSQLLKCAEQFTLDNKEVFNWCKQWTHDVDSVSKLYVRKAIY